MNLKDFYLFENLDELHLQKLEEMSTEQVYRKGQLLFLEGDLPRSLHVLTEGILKVFKSDPKGNEVVLNHFYPVGLVAELASLEHIPYPASAIFETDGKVIAIRYESFETDFLRNPDISFSIIKSLTRKLMTLDRVISHNLTMTSSSKVARFIYENEDGFSHLKQNKVASMLNMTPETMSRVVRTLREQRLIEKIDNKYRVVDRQGLKELFH